jgi:RecA-family ATPase
MRPVEDELIEADERQNVVALRSGPHRNRAASIEEMEAISNGARLSDSPALVEITAWDGEPVPDREWLVPDRIPARTVTGLSGDGGVGKSLIAAQLAAAMSLSRDWLGTMPMPGPSIYLSAEDDEDELRRRFARIAEHHGASFGDLLGLHVACLAGRDAVLAHADRSGVVQPTKLLTWLRQSVANVSPKLVIIDTAADVFAGAENDRSQVRHFVNLLRGIAIDYSTSVLLLSHPSLTGLKEGTGTSGSTAWNNSMRSRLYLKRAATREGDEPDPDLRELETMKANYAATGGRVRVRWSNGVFVTEGGPSSLERLARNQRVDETFLSLLGRFIEQGQDIGPSPGANYAPAVMARHPDATGFRKGELVEAQQRLLDGSKVRIIESGPASRRRKCLVLA